MKRIIIPVLLISCMISCDSNKKAGKEVLNAKDTVTETKTPDISLSKNGLEELEKKKADLENMTALTNEELTAVVPTEILGSARTDLDINNSMGTTVAQAKYTINDSVEIKLDIIDCGGPGGAGVFAMQYISLFDVNTDDAEEYVKTVEWKGGKAIENCKKNRNRCTFTYFNGTRFLVSLRGDNIGINGIKEIAADLKIR